MKNKEVIAMVESLECPWPIAIFPTTIQEYIQAIPNPDNRTAISGLLMRMGWEQAMASVKRKLSED